MDTWTPQTGTSLPEPCCQLHDCWREDKYEPESSLIFRVPFVLYLQWGGAFTKPQLRGKLFVLCPKPEPTVDALNIESKPTTLNHKTIINDSTLFCSLLPLLAIFRASAVSSGQMAPIGQMWSHLPQAPGKNKSLVGVRRRLRKRVQHTVIKEGTSKGLCDTRNVAHWRV